MLINMEEQNTILITGASGFLGWNTAYYLSGKFRVVGTVHTNVPGSSVPWEVVVTDITKENEVLALVKRVRPKLILHAAALTKPDACEKDPVLAENVNVHGTAALAKAADLCGCRLVYISTDLVFDGSSGMYSESDIPNPSLFYAKTKLMGEYVIKKHCRDYMVFRIAVMYGWGSPYHESFLEWLLKNVRNDNSVNLFADQYRSMLYVHQVALMIEETMENEGLWDDYNGETFHVGGGERISRYDFGIHAAERFSLEKEKMNSVEMLSVKGLAVRPADCSMNTSKIERVFNITPFSVRDGLAHLADSPQW